MLLEHYVAGRWSAPSDEGLPLRDAATGEEVARLSTEPVPAAEALRHAREVGGPALRAMTLHERAAAVKALALHLKETAREELYELSYATGSTARDTAIDVDGGIGTALGIASKARRELPDGHVALDGPVEQLGRAGTFLGRHVHTPLQGAAVQVNAYNFPVWGVLEKLAPALVGGMPSIVKPAPQTAYVSELLVRRVVESGLLPEGAVQLLVGDPEGLLDELGGQDVLAFTGSAATAARLRAHPAVVQRSVRFTAEADSLNACVLGPGADDVELDLFVREVAREMTAKAGQKCTAVRRALVPRQRLEEVGEALRAKLEGVVVGDPRDPATRMGALVSLEQRESVREGVARLVQGGRLLVGDPQQPFERGAFLPPLLVAHDDPRTPAPHEVEAFGPVSTLLPYDDPADVVPLLALGRGSLVGSVVSSDRDFVREVVRGAAAHHGRVLVLEETDAAESTGHGSPLPQLVHGGPGRAGGGEEEGGLRAVRQHLQCTAVQGTPTVLAALGG
jgi:oxepin-CoA hydrolase / 3-oxo-5,6-dehydrosuberyl-CoA semialdehyde dehydrogenase